MVCACSWWLLSHDAGREDRVEEVFDLIVSPHRSRNANPSADDGEQREDG